MKSRHVYLCVIAIVGSLLGMTHRAGALSVEDAGAPPAEDCPGQVDDRVYSQYGISGYWMFPDTDRCRNRKQVEAMHKIGSDTIITSSTELKRSSRDDLRESALFKDFAIDGADGYTAAEASLSDGETIERVFTYGAHYPFYSDALQCADRSGAADVGGKRYTYWLLPANGEDACVASDGKYSLVVAVNERGADDAALSTVENAELYGMKVYLGMPIPQMGQPGTSGYPAYVADDSYMGTLGAFTRNLLRSWMQAFGARTAFAGLYQGRETSVVYRTTAVHQHTLNVYASQNDVVAASLPEEKRRVVFSPYASFEDPSRAAYFEDRFRDIVHTGAGRVDVILAPQDGVGTGKVSPSDKDSVASPENVTTLYAAAQNASASETWANIELFVRDSSTCRAGSITFTSDCSAHKARIDQQIELAEPYAQKILAYDWSMYMSRARVSADSQETLVSYLLRTGAQNDALGEDQPRSSADVELEAAGDRPAGSQTDPACA